MPPLNATKKGLIIGALMIALKLFLFYALKYQLDNPYQNIIYIVYTLGIVWSMIVFAQVNSSTKLSAYFSNGFKTFVVITLLMVAFTFTFFTIHPEIKDLQIEANNQLLIQQGNHTAPEIEANAKQMKSIFMPMTLLVTTFLYLFLGAVITLLSSVAIMQMKKR
jgi:hypothetical protein